MADTRGRQVVLALTNKSGGSVAAGDVVVFDTTTDESFTTTTTGRAELSVGIAQETIASNAVGRVLVSGYAALVNVPASVTRGHYLETHTVVKQATGSATRRSGSFGQFAKTSATPSAWLWGQTDQTASGGGGGALVLLQTQTASASASLNYTTTITSTYDEYLVEFLNVIPATAATDLIMRMSTDGGSTYVSTASYAASGHRFAYDGVATDGGSPNAPGTSIPLTTGGLSASTNYGINGHLRLISPGSTAVYKSVVASLGYLDNQATPHLIVRTCHGAYLATTAVNAFQFLMGSGNIASGIIRTYGIAKT